MESWRSSNALLLSVASLALFVDTLVYGVVIPTLPSIIKERIPDKDSATEIGILFGSYAVGLLLVTPVIAHLSDRYGNRKIPMLTGLLGLAVSTLLFAYGRNYYELLCARMAQGIAGGISWTMSLCLVADAYSTEVLGSVMSKVFIANSLGFLLGPPIGGLLFTYFDAATPYIFCVGLAAIDLVARISLKPRQKTSEEDPLLTPRTEITPLGSTFGLVLDFQFIVTTFVVFLTSMCMSSIEITLPLYVYDRFHFEESQIGLVFVAISVPSILSSMIIGPLSDKYGRKSISFAGIVMNAISCPLILLSSNTLSLAATVGLFGFTSAIAMAPTMPEFGEIAERKNVGIASVYALFNVSYASGMLVGPMVGGFIMETYSFATLMQGFCVTMLAFSPIVIFSWYLSRKNDSVGFQEIE